jgi:hypothetical protein
MRGSTGAHEWHVEGAPQGRFFWVCKCGQGSEPVYGTENAAVEAATEHAEHAGQRGRRGPVPA